VVIDTGTKGIDTKAMLCVIIVPMLRVIVFNYIPKELLAELYVALLLVLIILFALVLKAKSIIH